MADLGTLVRLDSGFEYTVCKHEERDGFLLMTRRRDPDWAMYWWFDAYPTTLEILDAVEQFRMNVENQSATRTIAADGPGDAV